MTASTTTLPIGALATILFQMQQAVQMTSTTAPDDKKALGPMAPAWRAARQALGLSGKWATLDETVAALTQAAGGAQAPVAQGLSADMDFDMGAWDPVASQCEHCGSLGARTASGECSACGMR
jgi:hypothetical protein